MSVGPARKAVERLLSAAGEVAWRQWSSLDSIAASRRPAASIVDPEALVLLSLALVEHERRLRDVLVWWARTAPSLLSVQRMKNLAARHTPRVAERLREFAAAALELGRDFRWRPLARGTPLQPARPGRSQDADTPAPGVLAPPALMLRLRLGIGVGVKADILVFLLGTKGEWATTRSVAQAVGYTERSVRRAGDEMAAAAIVHSTGGPPVRYRVEPSAWDRLLGLGGEPPSWRYWHPVFALVDHLRAWPPAGTESSPYVASSHARDILEAHAEAFSLNRIEAPDARRYHGAAYLEALENATDRLVDWMVENA